MVGWKYEMTGEVAISPGLASIDDAIGCFCLSQVEKSRSSEWSPVGSGPMRLSMPRRRFSIPTVGISGTASPGSSSGDWGEHTFFHQTRDRNKPIRPRSWSGNP